MMAVVALFAFAACDNGNADIGDIIDNAPVITFGEFGVFFDNRDGSIPVTIQDGSADSDVSSIVQADYQIFDSPAGGNEVASGSLPSTGNGNLVESSVPVAGLVAGEYTLTVSTADSNGNADSQTTTFTVFQGFNTIGIIGDATPGGWGGDTDMTDIGDGVYQVTLQLEALFAKFRADDDWAVNWGAEDFPSGRGSQNGPNIPIAEAGTYKVTFDSKDSSYNFEKQ